jgi:hypothetical protein
MLHINNFKKIFQLLLIFICLDLKATSYNSFGQTGLISLPSAEVHDEQSLYTTFKRTSFIKVGTITATPFNWLEASYFYYRPDDLLWGDEKGLYLDKGFNVKFSYKPDTPFLPQFAIGLDDFAGTGQYTKEYMVATYKFNNFKLSSGMGWGKFVGGRSFRNPLSIIVENFEDRGIQSSNYGTGGSLSYDLWFRGDVALFGGFEIDIPKTKGLTFKFESNPFNYFQYSCCGEGLSKQSFDARKKESDFNFGISYKYKNFGNIDISYIKGNTWNISLSLGLSAKRPIRKKNKFKPELENNFYNETIKNEFYLDILENLNKNKLYLQTASINEDELEITIDSAEHFNPIISSSRAAYISKEISNFNNINFNKISVGHISRGAQINHISYRPSNLNLTERYPNTLVKKYSEVKKINPKNYKNHEFKPNVNFPVFIYNFSPDIRTHVGSPERFLYTGIGIKLTSEIQLNRKIVFFSTFGKTFESNFDKKVSDPASQMELVRTQIVDYLQESSKDIYIDRMEIERISSPYTNIFSKISIGILESMYGGIATEFMYKPFASNFAFSIEYNRVKKRDFDQKFSFKEYEANTSHFNLAYYHPQSNILAKWSYGKYLATDRGYTFDISRRMPSGWRAGIFFSKTNVSSEVFGEGSFDKGFYFDIPMNIFSKDYSKNINGYKMRTMTRDGGQKLELRNRLIDSFYGSSETEINENWNNYLD